MTPLRVEYCGEWYTADPESGLAIGREADVSIDDNPYLHRSFLRLFVDHEMWWIGNVGTVLAATVTDASGHVQAWLGPGARLPVVFEKLHVLFSAGATTYDFTIHGDGQLFASTASFMRGSGATTMEPIPLTSSQRLLILSLAENVLRERIPGRSELPSSAAAAERLGWSMTTFNRQLDNVCDKLDKLGVLGLRGGRGNLATGRRARLVEYAVSTRLVSADDLALLDQPRE